MVGRKGHRNRDIRKIPCELKIIAKHFEPIEELLNKICDTRVIPNFYGYPYTKRGLHPERWKIQYNKLSETFYQNNSDENMRNTRQ